jgi:hypothetical protein
MSIRTTTEGYVTIQDSGNDYTGDGVVRVLGTRMAFKLRSPSLKTKPERA